MALQSATKEGIAYRQNQIDEALALKESIFGPVESSGEAAKEPATTPSSVTSANKAEGTAEEATPPEAVTQGPTDAYTPEPPEEPNKQPSQWWLWLIGVLIVVGSLGLAIRRKS